MQIDSRYLNASSDQSTDEMSLNSETEKSRETKKTVPRKRHLYDVEIETAKRYKTNVETCRLRKLLRRGLRLAVATTMTSKRGLDPCLPCCSTCGPHLHVGGRGSDCNMDSHWSDLFIRGSHY